MKGEKAGFERLLSVMPEGWKGKAKELGALAHGREIKNAVGLLHLVFIYLTEGKSFSGTAALLQLGGICSITKKAVFTRFQKCGEWLRWLCERTYRNNHAVREAPQRQGRGRYTRQTPVTSRYTGAAKRITGCIMRQGCLTWG
jgi:hypothetical protein